MKNKKELPVKFRIQQIETLQFALLCDNIGKEGLSFSARFGFGLEPEEKLARANFKFELLQQQAPAILIEVAIDFAIEPECFDKQINQSGDFIIPRDFAIHLAMIAVGTTRGVLHEKTKGTPANAFPIPTIDITSRIKEDITFSIPR